MVLYACIIKRFFHCSISRLAGLAAALLAAKVIAFVQSSIRLGDVAVCRRQVKRWLRSVAIGPRHLILYDGLAATHADLHIS